MSHPRVVWCLYCVNNISIESVSLFQTEKQLCFVYLLVPGEEPLPFLVIFATVFAPVSLSALIDLSKISAKFLGNSHGCERLD